MAIDDAVGEKAKEISIAEKAGEISKTLGKEYYFIDSQLAGIQIPPVTGPELHFPYYYFEHGHKFYDSKIDIKTYFNSYQQNLVEISLREKISVSFLWFKIPTYTLKRVYTDNNGKVQLLENADEWLGHLEELYQKALEAKK